ncbi:MAG: hypothetical protein U0872_01155 [Planctomycetaceae bacterium]
MHTSRREFLNHSMLALAGAEMLSWCGQTTAAAAAQNASIGSHPSSGRSLNDPHLHLFVDDAEIERSEGLLRVINKPKKRSEPVVVADRPWEGDRAQAWGSVVQEPDGLLRMWYFSMNTEHFGVTGDRRAEFRDRGGYAYAESRDGIHWEKPDLGVVEFRGSKKNNLFYTFSPDGKNLVELDLARQGFGLPAFDQDGAQIGVVNNMDGSTVIRDDGEPDPQKRYKLIANMQDHRMWRQYMLEIYSGVTPEESQQASRVFGQYIDTSPDGIHWTRRPRRVSRGASGDYMVVMRDDRGQKWWLNERGTPKGGGKPSPALRTSRDLVNWSDSVVMFENGPDSDFGKTFHWHGGFTPFNYGNLNLGLLEKWPNAGFGATCELVCNRDDEPENWSRVAPGTPFLDIGPDGSFDRCLIYPTHNPPLRIGDTLYIYYTGSGIRVNANRGIPMAIGVATIPVDRFAGMACWRGPNGKLTTKPVTVSERHLAINVEVLDWDSSEDPPRVALTWPDGSPIPGYELENCRAQIDFNRVYTPISWSGKDGLSELQGKPVVLNFELPGAILYSYRFSADPV